MEILNSKYFLLSLLLCSATWQTMAKEVHSLPPIIRVIEVEKEDSDKGIQIQTQANSDKVIFHFDLKKWGKGTLRVSDVWGKLLLEKEIKDWTIGINLQDAVPGLYSITLEKDHLLEIVEIRKE